MPRTRPPYPEQFRREAVALVRSEGRSVRDVAESLGVSQQSLRAWLKQTQLDSREREDGLRSEEREELRRLQRENRRLRRHSARGAIESGTTRRGSPREPPLRPSDESSLVMTARKGRALPGLNARRAPSTRRPR